MSSSGNRFQDILQDRELREAGAAFVRVQDLAVEETLLSWDEICYVTDRFPALAVLYAGTNQLSSLSPIPPSSLCIATLTSLNLEYNDFTSVSDLASLASLRSLRNLHLKGNRIAAISSDPSSSPPVFTPSLHYVDLSYNKIAAWAFVDALPTVFPGLTSLRFTHNPVYDNPAFDDEAVAAAAAAAASSAALEPSTTATEEAYMITVGRLASLKSLNFSAIAPNDRTNAEMFYLSRIGRQLASVPEGAEKSIISQHSRYVELCELYGEPSVVRQTEINPAFLDARLISVQLRLWRAGSGDAASRAVMIPKSFDIYAVKGFVGKLFGVPPLKLRLVWETGEWDPVANFDRDAGDSSDEEEVEPETETEMGQRKERQADNELEESFRVDGKGARWVKREVELKDSPRQFGFCVDGLEATVRVELR